MSSKFIRHDGFNKWQIKDGYVVLMKKDGTIAKRFDKAGTNRKGGK